MSRRSKQISAWKLMLVGTSSVVMKRLFVVGLSVLSVATWTVTVVGMGVFRGPCGSGTTVKSALGSTAPATPVAPAARGERKARTRPAAAEGPAEAKTELVAPSRNPFSASETYFPVPKEAVKAPEAEPAAMDVAAAAAEAPEDPWIKVVDSLKIGGTFLKGGEVQAIIGNKLYGEGDRVVRGLWVKEVTKAVLVLTTGSRDYVVEMKTWSE